MTAAERFPLSWPAAWRRTAFAQRRHAPFHGTRLVDAGGVSYRRKEPLSVGDALGRLEGELRRLGATSVIVSSNLRLRKDGSLYADQAKRLDDPGVAVYFKLKGAARVLACDKWLSAADNLAAVAGHIEAIRTVDRYGVGSLDQAFAGYTALPPSFVDWPIVLGIAPASSRADILEAHRRLALEHHPDRGGRAEDMAKINQARDRALESV